MKRCPSDLELELYRALQRSPFAKHVAQCDGCQRRLAEMRLLDQEFRRDVIPRTIKAVRAAAGARQRQPRGAPEVLSLVGAKRLLAVIRSSEEAPAALPLRGRGHRWSPAYGA